MVTVAGDFHDVTKVRPPAEHDERTRRHGLPVFRPLGSDFVQCRLRRCPGEINSAAAGDEGQHRQDDGDQRTSEWIGSFAKNHSLVHGLILLLR